jgi:N6-adenosine-specific RNA methylase IME4
VSEITMMTELPVDEVVVGERHRADLGDVAPLAESIRDLGLLHPIVVTPSKRLVAGERRLHAVRSLGWERVPVTVVAVLDDACAALRAERDENTCRKDLSVTEKVALGERLEALEAAAARSRQGARTDLPEHSGKFPEGARGEVRDKVGQAVGLSGRSYTKAKAVVQAASADPVRFGRLAADMDRSGKVDGAFRRLQTLRAAERLAVEPPPLPEGPFRVLAVDPPWSYVKRPDDPSHRGACPYPCLSAEEIAGLPVPSLAHEDAVLWLWATNAHLPDAFGVLRAWGFEHKTVLTWVKDRMGTGDWLRGQTEHCLMAVRGRPAVTLTSQTTVIQGPLREHSRKPTEFYRLVESLCPGSKVELFAREVRPGWAAHGDTSCFPADQRDPPTGLQGRPLRG